MYPNFDDDSDEIDYGYSEQIDHDIDNESIDEDIEADSDSAEINLVSEEKWVKKEAWSEFMEDWKTAPIFRYYYDDAGGNTGYLYLMLGRFFMLDLYWEIDGGIDPIGQEHHWYYYVGAVKQRIDHILYNDTEYNNVQTFLTADLISTEAMVYQLVDQTYLKEDGTLIGCNNQNHGGHAHGTSFVLTSAQATFATIEQLFEHEWFPLWQKNRDEYNYPSVTLTDLTENEEPIDEEPIDEEPIDEEPIDEDSYSETLWALEPGYYMSYYANLGFIIPNRYAIDVLIADRVSKYGFLPIVQVTLPLELNWIPEMAQLVALGTSLSRGFLGSQQSQIVSSATITKPASQYVVTYYPSRVTHTLASAMEASGGNFNLSTFIKGSSGLNPMVYSVGIHIEDIIGKVARSFSTVWLLPMKDYVGFNREDSVPEPNYDAIEDLKHYIRSALIKENLISFNKIEVYDASKVEASNLGPAIDNIMTFDNWLKVRDSMNRYIDSLKVNAFGFGRIFDQMVRNWKIWNVPSGSKLTKHADFFARSGPYENMTIWGYMQDWAESHYIDESIKGSSKSTILWQ